MANWDKIVTDLVLQVDGSWKEPIPVPRYPNAWNVDMYSSAISDELLLTFLNHFKNINP